MSVSPKHTVEKSVSNRPSDLIERSKAIEAIEALASSDDVAANFAYVEAITNAMNALRALPAAGWQDIESADTTEYTRIMAWNGERVGEAVAYHEYCEENDYEGGFVAWRWANDSCPCCWGDMNSQPILWQPMPTPPAIEAAMGHGE